MPLLWIHRCSGSDLLVHGDDKTLVNLAQKIFNDRNENITCKNSYGTIGETSDIEISLYDDHFLPDRRLYHDISYVFPEDAYTMTVTSTYPESHFRHDSTCVSSPLVKLPKGFLYCSRDEPYDFTRQIPSNEQIDQELANYYSMYPEIYLPSEASIGLDPMNCPLHSQKITGCMYYSMDEDGNYPAGTPPCCCSMGINEAIARGKVI